MATASSAPRSSRSHAEPQPSIEARCWRFSDEHIAASPSVADGMSPAAEAALRRAGAAHMLETIRLVLEAPWRGAPESSRPPRAAFELRARMPSSTALVLFNRFYMRHSFMRHDRFVRALHAHRHLLRAAP